MCLAVPGKIADIYDAGGIAMARVDFGGVTREACLAYLPEAAVGGYVLVHAGFAITMVDEAEARQTLEDLRQLGELMGEDEPGPGGRPPA
jgi:hydrogenase expression/formation protein HypC